MTQISTWHGTEDELRRLTAAVKPHCTCATDLFGRSDGNCGPHRMLADERVLDHLLYVYRSRDRFRRAERSMELGALADTSAYGFWSSEPPDGARLTGG